MSVMEYVSTQLFAIFILFLMNYLLGPLTDFLIELCILLHLSAVHYVQISDNSSLSIMPSSPISRIFYFFKTISNKSEQLISSFFIDCAHFIFTKFYYQVCVILCCCCNMNLYSIKYFFVKTYCDKIVLNQCIKTLHLLIILRAILMIHHLAQKHSPSAPPPPSRGGTASCAKMTVKCSCVLRIRSLL